MPLEEILKLKWAVEEPEPPKVQLAPPEKPVAESSLAIQRAVAFSKVRETLLTSEPQHIKKLDALVGVQMAKVIRTCLEGPESFGIPSHRTQRDQDASRKLQTNYTKSVVSVISRLSI